MSTHSSTSGLLRVDWLHPWKIGKYPVLREFMREIKRNMTERPDVFDDFGLRAHLEPRQDACH